MVKKKQTQIEKDAEAAEVNARMKTLAYLKSIGKEA